MKEHLKVANRQQNKNLFVGGWSGINCLLLLTFVIEVLRWIGFVWYMEGRKSVTFMCSKYCKLTTGWCGRLAL